MSQYEQNIINYGNDVSDLASSPFESLRMLHDRTALYKIQHRLNYQEKVLLAQYDLKLIENAEKMVKHINNIYDFELSDDIPSEQWWWHLDKIANGTMDFGVSSKVGKVM
ncbi:hypothetical protein [Virgibacillus halodenitrificans]|uniref:hypothetical protein n=1 Tax=Virgibacillus halodenitrificans TaxID=1482 RepID=UPI002DBB758E|nr:hypothetical protein [Virgibacillus halodenitrificans]MEC2159752.1 hypothetical protein [Virgibacillus halodenitrificans]